MWDLSSLTRDGTCVPCIGRQILYHWTTREVPVFASAKQQVSQWLSDQKESYEFWPPNYPRVSLELRIPSRDLFITVFHPDPKPRQVSYPLLLQGQLSTTSPTKGMTFGGFWIHALFSRLLLYSASLLLFLRLAHLNQCFMTLVMGKFSSLRTAFSLVRSLCLCFPTSFP